MLERLVVATSSCAQLRLEPLFLQLRTELGLQELDNVLRRSVDRHVRQDLTRCALQTPAEMVLDIRFSPLKVCRHALELAQKGV